MFEKKNFLLINKPEGWTSFDVVDFVRKQMTNNQANPPLPRPSEELNKQKRIKVGHAGTLDPFATGLLIVGVGREATKKLDEFKAMPKTYVATIKLGATSDTYDKTGHITTCHPEFILGSIDKMLKQVQHDNKHIPSLKQIKKVINSFKGKQKQIPPMFSAKKINGQRLYALARKGIEVERQPSEIEIYKIKILDYTWPFLKIEVQCSAGTYIRSLAHGIGAVLGTGAYCKELIRTKIGDYSLDDAITPQSLLITP